MSSDEVRPENLYYITKTCYVIPERHILVNNGVESEELAALSWSLLNHFLKGPNCTFTHDELINVLYEDDFNRDSSSIALAMTRLRQYFKDIGVDKKDIDKAFQTRRGVGYYFSPEKPPTNKLREVIKALRGTGISENELISMIECMLYRGISGRMGREGVFALARQKIGLAALEVGELYYHGYCTRNHKPDFQKACEWYHKAGNHPTALWTLGYCIMNNFYPQVDPSEIDYAAARDYFVQASSITTESCASAAALTSLGQLWEEGHYPADDFDTTHRCEKPNIGRAIEYYKQADELGYHYATNRLGRYYEKKQDLREAFRCFSRSVELVPDGYALNKLGQYYENGFGCKTNPSKACECYMRGVDEVLEDDVTGWNFFNAGRVCANRITGQPERYYDLPRAFDLFEESLRVLPIESHDQILLEMIDILLYGDVSGLSSENLARKKDDTKSWAQRYLTKAMDSPAMQRNEKTDRIRALIKKL